MYPSDISVMSIIGFFSISHNRLRYILARRTGDTIEELL
ncbi:MAG: hypothetical protein J07HQW2_02266 [Haloquadratum walsbyi J07HQW2]|uniref:Uncharacterized protein n=1 Tax=Haloquadratum walsbyi J07HQW2 TaxID=1238425 RepID=U1PTU1_9EURY|nr:MAG: hypothetical protein J07HQW2_02266 [Haloquadratum walsbyi J07HQW2]